MHFYQINPFECVTFAWFTSKDEVTNRLSASGDYGVSIVESFAPPAKWVPGQQVNKDVYAVNTGDVEAYVKETVSSVLTIVTEEATTGITTPDADCIELSAGERYVVEAGAYLAYAPRASEFTYDDGENVGQVVSGRKVISMTPGATEYDYESAATTDFQPDAEGLYVFRRTIDVNDDTVAQNQLEKYTYEAYYYVPGNGNAQKQKVNGENKPLYTVVGGDGTEVTLPTEGNPVVGTEEGNYKPVMETVSGVGEKFYKVSNLAVTPEKATFAGDLDQRDGMVDSGWRYTAPVAPATEPTYTQEDGVAPTYGFYKDETQTIVPKLTYDKVGNRLIASFDTGSKIDKSKLLDLADKYEDASVAYEDALEEYQAAIRDQQVRPAGGTDAALATATTNLQNALGELLAAKRAKDAAQAAYDKAEAERGELYTILQAANQALLDAQGDLGSDEITNVDPNTVYGRYHIAQNALGSSDDATTADTAWGHENAAKDAMATALNDYNVAHAATAATDPTARQAFITYIKDNNLKYTNADNEEVSYLNAAQDDIDDAVTYEILHNAGFTNDAMGDEAFLYYTKLVNEMYAKEALDTAQATYENAIANRKDAERDLAIATEELNAALAALGNTTDTTTENDTVVGRRNKAQNDYDKKMVELYGNKAGGTGSLTNTEGGEEGNYTADSLFGKLQAATTTYDTEVAETTAAQEAYNEALANSDVAAENVKAAADNVAKTKQAMDNTKAAYDAAYAADTGELKINIKLGDVTTEGGVADKWQILPESLEDLYNNTTTAEYGAGDVKDNIKDTASFYYTSILGGGETTSKLIDYVELDETVTKEMFKYFDFDLNVTLNSAQVTFDNDGNYTTDAVITENGFNKYAILSDNTSADTAITWSDTSTIPESAAAKKYDAVFKGGDNNLIENVKITELATPKFIDYEPYYYEATAGGKTYYGNGVSSGDIYYKYDSTTGKVVKDNTADPAVYDNKVTLNANATVDNT